jgi:hypothetical protein
MRRRQLKVTVPGETGDGLYASRGDNLRDDQLTDRQCRGRRSDVAPTLAAHGSSLSRWR